MPSAGDSCRTNPEKAPPVRVLIVDKADINRLGLKAALSSLPGFDVVGEAADGENALKAVLRLHPDVVILDIDLPQKGGMDALVQIKKATYGTRVIILTHQEDGNLVASATSSGADGYCLKDINSRQLTLAISKVMAGHRWIDPRLTRQITEVAVSRWQAGKKHGKLQELELKIFEMVAGGADSKEIASRLVLSLSEVQAIISSLVDKLLTSIEKPHLKTGSLTTAASQLWHKEALWIDTPKAKSGPETKDSASSLPAILRADGAFDGRYQLESVIGIGGMSIVYKAIHLHMERIVAIKVLHPDSVSNPKLIARLKAESKAISALEHPNIVSVHDFGVTEAGHPYLVMDYVEGQPLNKLFEQVSLVDAYRYIDIFAQVCDGLAATHAKGLIHCDLKPSNIMLQDNDTGRDLVKILDFGLAKFLPKDTSADVRLTDSYEVTGSPLYMSPEQCRGGTIDARSDLYSLGCIMYEAFAGRPVFDGNTPYKVFSQHLTDHPKRFIIDPSAKSIPPALEEIVFKTLEKKQDERFNSALEVKEALLGCNNHRKYSEIKAVPKERTVTQNPKLS